MRVLRQSRRISSGLTASKTATEGITMKLSTPKTELPTSTQLRKAAFGSFPNTTRFVLRKRHGGSIVKSLCAAALLVLMAADSGRATDLSLKRQNALENSSFREFSSVQLDTNKAVAVQAKRDRIAKYPKLVQRLEWCLIDAKELAATKGVQSSTAALRASKIQMQGENIIVIVECAQTTNPKDVAALIVAKGGTVIRTGEAHVQAAVPVTALEDIACNIPGVSFVQTPIEDKASNTVLTEGRGAVLASPWHAAGYLGQGVKVAVIDVDFLGLATRKAQDEIPASAIEVDFSGTGMTSGTDGHGCACAEIIYDMAPACQLYLLKVLNSSDLEAAKNYCKAQGIQIISRSTGYENVNFYDGTAPSSIVPHPVTIVNDANANGILWVNAAGNDQQKHALIAWQDANANGYLDWTSTSSMNELWNNGNPIPAGATIDVSLTWNKWPVTDQDFDLDLYYLNGTTWTYVTSAEAAQNGSQPPREHLVYTVTTAGRYAVAIYKYSATTSPTFILRDLTYDAFYFGYNNYSTPAPGSLTCPGDAASAFTVGAIDYLNYTVGPIETYSGLGPNNGAYTGNPSVVKPDICGPTWVSTATDGTEGFGGTSASAPHVAGLAALVKCAYPSYTPAQIKSYIESNGYDLGTVGKDNAYGSGAARLPTLMTTVHGTPYLWLDQYGLVSGGNYEAADAGDTDGDGYTAWQEYVAGTVPTNRASVFRSLIGVSNGVLRVTWTPDIGMARAYTVEGRTNLTGAVWGTTNASSRFFRVKVGLP